MRASEYYGHDIYSDKGNYIGEVKQIVIDAEKGVIAGLAFDEEGGKWIAVPYENVMAIGDIILAESVRKVRKEKQVETEETEEKE